MLLFVVYLLALSSMVSGRLLEYDPDAATGFPGMRITTIGDTDAVKSIAFALPQSMKEFKESLIEWLGKETKVKGKVYKQIAGREVIVMYNKNQQVKAIKIVGFGTLKFKWAEEWSERDVVFIDQRKTKNVRGLFAANTERPRQYDRDRPKSRLASNFDRQLLLESKEDACVFCRTMTAISFCLLEDGVKGRLGRPILALLDRRWFKHAVESLTNAIKKHRKALVKTTNAAKRASLKRKIEKLDFKLAGLNLMSGVMGDYVYEIFGKKFCSADFVDWYCKCKWPGVGNVGADKVDYATTAPRADPWITQFSGSTIGCQGEGEFTLLKSQDTLFEVQARMSQVPSTSYSASVITGVAIREQVQGVWSLMQLSISEKSPHSLEKGSCQVDLYVDASLITEALPQSFHGGEIEVSETAGDVIIFFTRSKLRISARPNKNAAFGCYFSVQFIQFPVRYGLPWLPGHRSTERLYGLVGNPHDSKERFFAKNGTVLEKLSYDPTATSKAAAYTKYCQETFCVRDPAQSLFTYEEGSDFASFENCDSPFNEIDVNEASVEVRERCGTDIECLKDGVVGGLEAAEANIADRVALEQLQSKGSAFHFSPSVIAVSGDTPTPVDVSVQTMQCYEDLTSFAVYVVEEDGTRGELVAVLRDDGVPPDRREGDLRFTGRFGVMSSEVGEVFRYTAVPVFDEGSLDESPLTQQAWAAIRSYNADDLPKQSAAGSVNLTDWSSVDRNGVWVVSADGTSVTQTQNHHPTFFCGPLSSMGADHEGTFRVATTSDDDFAGFALGYNLGDLNNETANYVVVDWKENTQDSARKGLAAWQVKGILNEPNPNFWLHQANDGSNLEIARGLTLGDVGWSPNQDYVFRFELTENRLKVYVNDVLEIDVAGEFSDGPFCFYNYSQQKVVYSGFTAEEYFPLPIRDVMTCVA